MRRLAAVALSVFLAVTLTAAISAPPASAVEIGGGGYTTLVDPDGNEIIKTGFSLSPGDEFIDEKNARWRVEQVIGNKAQAVFVEQVDLSTLAAEFELSLAEAQTSSGGKPQVGIYHTHSDESYIPSDGTDSVNGIGGVYKVGDVLSAGLQKMGVTVIHSYASHLPHDGGAYERSRSTAASVLSGSAAVFDVHRDSGPAESYLRRVGGQVMTQVMIVLGKANPGYQANLSFASAVKSAADKQSPGLLRGILSTGGRYNQDLSRKALLFEFGTEQNRREDAETAANNLAKILPGVVGAAGTGGSSSGAWRAAGVIAIIVVVGGGLWLLVASGGNLREAWRKLTSLGEEFANFLGGRRRRDRR